MLDPHHAMLSSTLKPPRQSPVAEPKPGTLEAQSRHIMLYTALHSRCNRWLHKQGKRPVRKKTRSKKQKQLDSRDVSLSYR